MILEHSTPHVYYGGTYPVAPLTDATAGPWTVVARAHLRTEAGPGPVTGTLTAVGSWAPGAPVSVPLSLPAGTNTSAAVNLTVPVGAVSLWWPNGAGSRTLYTVTVTFTPAAGPPIVAARRIGFRTFYTVTADDTSPVNISGVDGSSDFTMRFKVGRDIGDQRLEPASPRRSDRTSPPSPSLSTAPRPPRRSTARTSGRAAAT